MTTRGDSLVFYSEYFTSLTDPWRHLPLGGGITDHILTHNKVANISHFHTHTHTFTRNCSVATNKAYEQASVREDHVGRCFATFGETDPLAAVYAAADEWICRPRGRHLQSSLDKSARDDHRHQMHSDDHPVDGGTQSS